jgi:hypothetical protein
MGNLSFKPEGMEEGAGNAERLVIPFAETVQVGACPIVERRPALQIIMSKPEIGIAREITDSALISNGLLNLSLNQPRG